MTNDPFVGPWVRYAHLWTRLMHFWSGAWMLETRTVRARVRR
ncbi:hypothetical protein [Falsiroseomonas sp. HW251]